MIPACNGGKKMFTYLLINDATNKMVHSESNSLPGFRTFGKYYDEKQISCFTNKVLSTLQEDIDMLRKLCGLSF